MGLLPGDSERRTAYRFAVSGPRETAHLRVGSLSFPVRVVDESAGGFGVLCDEPPPLEPGAVARLFTGTEWFEVQVANIGEPDEAQIDAVVEHRAPEAELTSLSTAHPPVRLGLCRLRDLGPPEQPRSWWATLRSVFGRSPLVPLAGPLASLGVILAVAAVLAGAGAVVVMWQLGYAFLPVPHSPTTASGVGRMAPAEPQEPPPTQPTAGPSGSLAEETRNLIRNLPGANVFLLPEVVKALKLTAQQQAEIGRLIDATADALRQLDIQPESNRRRRAEQHAELFDEARQKALDLLSDEQRAKWQALWEDIVGPTQK